MPLVTIRDLSIRFRGPALFDSVSSQIEPGERIGLLGRNGSGKTTLLRMLTGEVDPDQGEVQFAPGTRAALLTQEVPRHLTGQVRETIANGAKISENAEEPAWQVEQRVEQILFNMELPADARFETLSSGMKRRVLLARAIAASPDLLLLDEPTNHLDVDAIIWIEDFLSRWKKTLVFVTHDRMFLRKLATRILEIDRGRLFDWSCDYDTFISRKEDLLAAEEKQNALFDKRLADEEVWIRTGIKARRTRNEGRVRALEEMRRVRRERRDPTARVQMAIQEGQRSGVLVAAVNRVSFSYDSHPIVRDFSTTIMRGDKIGILGPNGAGKTTLLRILLGQLAPQSGSVRLGTNLQIAYFDQLRQQLNDDASVQECVGDGYETLQINGKPQHIIGYLRDFLFSPDRARTPIRFLSGGERNRVLLAKLFAKPANVIVLDEPTNDLDTETLELLEAQLVQFDGTVLLVSHDREFLNNVVTSTIVFEHGDIKEYVGGYDDWLRQRPERSTPRTDSNRSPAVTAARSRAAKSQDDVTQASTSDAQRKRKLTFKERQEVSQLPKLIEQIEAQIGTLHRDMAQADFYRQPGEQIAMEQDRLKLLEQNLSVAYERLEELGEIE